MSRTERQRNSRQDSKTFSPPGIPLPTGGGAIRGIDEKLTVNAVNGSATLSLPLPLAPARSGFGPELSLAYDSAAGNGPFGLGWRVPVPAIGRRTDNGLPRYFDQDESDTYLLAGTEDLVPLLRPVGAAWEPFAETRLENGETYRVRRYRPRIEGVFARIERWERLTDGDVHWRTLSKDNVTALYGPSSESRIADPDDLRRIFAWLLAFTYDALGNCLRYRYKAENLEGIDPVHLHEQPRLLGRARLANRYLKKVQYGNRTPYRVGMALPEEFHFETVFDYGEHDLDQPAPNEDAEWEARPDPFSDYRAGFEIRTYRRCRRVLLFHRFPELGETPCLVRALELGYTVRGGLSLVTNLSARGYIHQADGSYTSVALPPLHFSYQPHAWNTDVQRLDAESQAQAPIGLHEPGYQWVDLHREGLFGILSEHGGGWYYKRNLGDGKFGPATPVSPKPSFQGLRTRELLVVDLDASGESQLVSYLPPHPGYFELDPEGSWRPFRTFEDIPLLDFTDPNLRMIDLTGDGRADLLMTEDEVLTWVPSDGRRGFAAAEEVPKPLDEQHGPRLMFADGTQTIFLADMNGDRLADLVRIRNGEIAYWPNIGYGHFGARILMDGAPWLDHAEDFDPRRVRLADIDGSGPSDLIYLGRQGVRAWQNQSGNAWESTPLALNPFPHLDWASQVSVVDLLGSGTACLVWSSPLPGDTPGPLHYVDLMASQKPHLMTGYRNNLGKEVTLHHRASTHFYLEDERNGHPWATRLPFPVHCVSEVEVIDRVTGNRFTTEHSYHHGYYDHREREFRGFGLVDQLDSESYEHFVLQGAANVVEQPLHQPPVLTRNWFHTGAHLAGSHHLGLYAHEYYQNSDLPEHPLPEAVMPSGLSSAEQREARRACKGLTLRQEVYALDGGVRQPHPYVVSQNSWLVQRLQPAWQAKPAIFLVTPAEAITYHYERRPDDPRIAHSMTLETGPYGEITRAAAAVYPRRGADASLPADVQAAQAKLHLTLSETGFTGDLDTNLPRPAYRLRLPCEMRTYECNAILPGDGLFFRRGELQAALANAAAIPFEATFDGAQQKRLVGHTRTLFRRDDLSGPLPLGQMHNLGLTYQSYTLAFSAGLVNQVYGAKVDSAVLSAAGYMHSQGDPDWWLPSAIALYAADAADHFYLPLGARDPLGNDTTIHYDSYDVLVERTLDPAGNEMRAENDYRLLGPVLTIDPNLNRGAVQADELGFVVRSAQMAKAGAGEGDSLADPTTRLEYELFNWMIHGKPNFVHTFAREQHGQANPRWQESYAYSDGSGNVVMTKIQAEPGPARQLDDQGNLIEIDTSPNPRWVANGRTVLNNKGNPVKKFEPYFSVTPDFESAAALVETGVTPLLHYDPLGLLVRTELPDGALARTEFDAWRRRSFDPNDAVLDSAWYAERGSPSSAGPEPIDPQERAAWLAAQHADTPTIEHRDSLGRAVHIIADNGPLGQHGVRSEIDLAGRRLRVYDPRDRLVAEGLTNLVGQPVQAFNHEKGERWLLHNALGNPVRLWDGGQRAFRLEYDVLQRTRSVFVQEGAIEALVTHSIYGESLPNGADLNLRGRLHKTFDQAGMVTVVRYDFKGNPLRTERRFARDYRALLDWSPLLGAVDLAALETAAAPLLEGEVFSSEGSYDALNRPVRARLPDQSVLRPAYNEANLLEALEVQLRGQGDFITFVQNQDHNARGQRVRAACGNGATLTYTYDERTFRLANLRTERESDGARLQDLTYTYDPVGNLTAWVDRAQQAHFFNNAVVPAEAMFAYDALYQLVWARGREHAGNGNDAIRGPDDLPVNPLPHPNNAAAVRNYSEEYEYDELGNLLRLRHHAGAASWTRNYQYDASTNRLLATSTPGDPPAGPYSATYVHDDHGNMARMPHLSSMAWNFMDQLREVDLGGGGRAYYVYGSGGQRLRKVIQHLGGTREERLYLGNLEIYRRFAAGARTLERQTLLISDGSQRIAQVDTKTFDAQNPAGIGQAAIRYQYGDCLGSAVMELDENAALLTCEAYHPYGATAYRSARSAAEASLKRYRYTSKERDDETGLSYHGARYYAPWLGRWTSSDPAGFVDGLNLYRYARNNPATLSDPSGTDPPPRDVQWIVPPNVTTEEQFSAWATRTGIQYSGAAGYNPQTRVWSVESWTRVQPGVGGPAQPPNPTTPPTAGQYGHVAPYSQQAPAQYGTPGVPSTRLTESEHVTPGAQLRQMTTDPSTGQPDYTEQHYRNDATVRVERSTALDKTHGNRGGPTADNPRTQAMQGAAQSGRGVNYREEVFEASRQNAVRAARATNSVVTEQNINRAILEQEGNLFSLHRGSVINRLPQQSFGQRVVEGARNVGRAIVYTPGGYNRFSQAGGTLARGLIPGFVEAEMAAISAPYVVASLGITNTTIVSTAAAAAAAPAAAATTVVASAAAGYIVGDIVESAVTGATGSRAAGVVTGTLAAAATGALIGAAIGTIVPGLGTAAGAIIGGVVGGIAGFIGSFW